MPRRRYFDNRERPDTILWDCGRAIGSPLLPGGMSADLAFAVTYSDGEVLIGEDDFTVSLFDEEGEHSPIRPDQLPLIRAGIVAHMQMAKRGKGRDTEWQLLVERASEHANFERAA
jgi:hypothetical protein